MISAAHLARTLRTVRHLKFKQIAYRIRYAICKPSIPQNIPASLRQALPAWNGLAFRNSHTTDGVTFSFLGETRSVRTQGDWNTSDAAVLWLYNLHYLDSLSAIDLTDDAVWPGNLIDRWIADNPPPLGRGWEPYPLSLRIVNLVKWCSRQSVAPNQLNSLAQQARALNARVEHHILANHLFSNAKALVFAGVYFSGDEADRWLRRGLGILDAQLREQFLPDGAHFELSPMYHAIAMWDICELLNLARQSGLPTLQKHVPALQSALARGMVWLRAMCHPDGDISFFNDAALGIAPRLGDLERYVQHVCLPAEIDAHLSVCDLASSGYLSVPLIDHGKLLLDLAEVGAGYQPGHAHADTLSFELSLFGRRFFVNGGASRYGTDAIRLQQRSTKAHNTVEIDGQNSSEVWSGFRVGRRAHMVKRIIEQPDANTLIVIGAHDGYRHLGITHERHWNIRTDGMTIRDTLSGPFQSAIMVLHAHPDVSFVREDEHVLRADLPSIGQVTVEIDGADATVISKSHWNREFGVEIPNQCLHIAFTRGMLTTRIGWRKNR